MNGQETTTEIIGIPPHILKLLLGLLILFIVVMSVGFAFEIFPVEEEVETGAKVTAAILGVPFLWLGSFLVIRAIDQAVSLSGIRGGSFPSRLLIFLSRRVSWKTFLSGSPYLLLSGQLAYFLHSGLVWPFGSSAELIELYVLEFGVIHATVFLGIISLVPATGKGKPIKYILFLLVGAFYIWAMSERVSFYGYLSYGFLLLSKFGGYFLRPPSADSRFSLFLRWLAHFATFLLVTSALGNPELTGRANILCGLWYFLMLGIYEILDIFSVETKFSDLQNLGKKTTEEVGQLVF